MGRLPKPTVLKLLEGNPGRRRLNTREPDPRPATPTCPDWLDATARAEWRRVVPELRRLRLLTLLDRAALVCYVQAYSDFRAAVETIAREGRTVTTSNGNTIQHPAVGQRNKAMLILKQFVGEFGLSPASRVRIQVPVQEKAKSAWEGLLA